MIGSLRWTKMIGSSGYKSTQSETRGYKYTEE